MNNFTTKQGFFLYSFDIDVKEKKKIDHFLMLLEDSGIDKLISLSSFKDNPQGRYPYNPYNMFAMIIYAFAFGKGTLREIERSCKLGLDYIYIMNNEKPSYVSISNFINDVFAPNIHQIFKIINVQIIKKMELNIDDAFIDGSKFEANANKYKFVWKPDKKQLKLSEKVRLLISKYDIKKTNKVIKAFDIASYISQVKILGLESGIEMDNIITGRGHRLKPIQRDYILLRKYLSTELEYEEQLKICGDDRNSYYKTDFDATAMCLKEDYYSGLGSNMHAAYNVQYLVSQGLILDVYVSQDRTDYKTLIPCLNSFKSLYGFYPKNLCADSGYGSHSNYTFINSHNIGNYVKYPLWESERSGKNPQLFIEKDGKIYCLNNKVGEVTTDVTRHPRSKDSKFYKFTGCRKCIFKDICKRKLRRKSDPFRIVEISIDYLKEIQQVRANLLSPKGIEIRVNRSIQVEGDFGITKQNMSYVRFRRRGLNKVLTEITLVALGINIRKYFRFVESGEKPNFWTAPIDLQAEAMPTFKQKPPKTKPKGKNEKLKKEYKYRRKRL